MLTDREQARAGPRSMKAAGSPEWCWQTLDFFKSALRHVDEQYRQAEQILQELEQVKAWTKVPPDAPYGSLNKMLMAEIGLRTQQVRGQIRTAQRVADRAKALNGKTINSGHSPRPTGDVITSNDTGKGTSADYLTRRIVRDHPEIAARMEAGEFASVRAAALEAGIVHRTVSVRPDDPPAVARALRKHMTPAQVAELRDLLTD